MDIDRILAYLSIKGNGIDLPQDFFKNTGVFVVELVLLYFGSFESELRCAKSMGESGLESE